MACLLVQAVSAVVAKVMMDKVEGGANFEAVIGGLQVKADTNDIAYIDFLLAVPLVLKNAPIT